MQEIPDELRCGPFTVETARALGVSEKVLRGKRFRSPFPGVRVLAELADTPDLRLRAAVLALPGEAAFSHETALGLHALPLPFAQDSLLHVSVPPGARLPRIAGIVAHRADWRPGSVVVRRGLRVTTAVQTWVDLAAAGWTRDELVVQADALLRRYGARAWPALEAAVRARAGRRGVEALRRAFALAAERVDSPMETRLRLLVVDAGLPVPVVNQPVLDDFDEVVHVPDLSWPRWRVAVDFDGAHHFVTDRTQDVAARRRVDWRRRHDIARQESLQAIGWTLRIATAYDVLHEPEALLHRIGRSLRDAGAQV